MKKETEKPKEIKPKKSKFSDQNQPPKNVKSGNNSSSSKLKSASSWGSHIVKGLGGERKSKFQTTTMTANKLSGSFDSQNNLVGNRPISSKVKGRGLIGDLSCSVVATQVHPHALQGTTNNNNKVKVSSSQDLFVEIENLRTLLKESKQREFQLQSELSETRKNQKVLELEREVEGKKNEVESLTRKIKFLESDSKNGIGGRDECEKDGFNEKSKKPKNVEMEVVELRRLNKELQLQKRNLSSKVTSLESQLSNFAKVSENENMGKIKAEASLLRRTNEDLSKQVEGLQMSRLNEVEELAYLRWVNAQLRNELGTSPCLHATCDVELSSNSEEISTPLAGFPHEILECSSGKRLSVVKKLSGLDCSINSMLEKRWEGHLEETSSGRRHSISGSKCCDEDFMVNRRRQSQGFMCLKQVDYKVNSDESIDYQKQETIKVVFPTEVEKRALRIPNPPPRPSSGKSNEAKEVSDGHSPVAPPPPPPPPPPPQRLSVGSNVGAVQRAPQVVEFYHSLMKRDTHRDSSGGATSDSPNLSSVRSNMIGEIENRSSYLLAIKADVETQGEFVNSLIREVNTAVYRNIDDVVAFVKWLDDELCFLVDERAVLKHFDWPEKKADTLREAAFGYKDLNKLEMEVTYYHDDPRLPCDIALRKMVSLSEKIERTIYNILRTREPLMRICKDFQIPTDWMLDSGIISKVKLGSVKLAKKYMNRVATELQLRSSLEKDVAMDYMLLQGVRFAFRIHQFAGGFDWETMQAFEQLRKLAHALDKR
ncbi:protein CHUP1, chloroplastic [Spinacia oleracea]|uniref:Protein CHUP1, chloroplastic n=1 Tax=Spinacia oleracea TaxID=3562 RepID=A0A9R0HSE4_SPIOL|nr:protein CHUP1, chloroplastic-like [Spinacia oleracea]